MAWARAENRVVFTHDLNFGTALALTHAAGPSVIQVRGQRVLPEHLAPLVFAVLERYESELSAGALWWWWWSKKPGAACVSFCCESR